MPLPSLVVTAMLRLDDRQHDGRVIYLRNAWKDRRTDVDGVPHLARGTCAARPPAAGHQGAGGRCARRALASVRRDVRRNGATLSPAGTSAQEPSLDRAVLGPQRAAVLRAARVQPVAPVVRRMDMLEDAFDA